jgi:hypothetical protein
MTLSFSTDLNGKPTYFVEKIWKWLYDSDNKDFLYNAYHYEIRYQELIPCQYVEAENIHSHKPKLHTIRKDEGNRWKAGNLIHPVINNRTADRFQFANEFECMGTQKFKITWFECIDDGEDELWEIEVNDRVLNLAECIMLAVNDGFEGLTDFLEYFNRDFDGKIIHWTSLKY